MVMKQSASELREELNRVNSENKKLTETLATVYENYYALQHHLEKLQSRRQSPETDQLEQPLKRRKQDSDESLSLPNGLSSGINENSSSNEAHHHHHQQQQQYEQKNQLISCKRSVTDSFNKAQVSTVYVPAVSSDTSLVSVSSEYNVMSMFVMGRGKLNRVLYLWNDFADSKRWISMEEIRTKSYKR